MKYKKNDVVITSAPGVSGIHIIEEIGKEFFTFNVGFLIKNNNIIEYDKLPDKERNTYITDFANSSEVDMMLDYINKKRRSTTY